MRVVSQESWTAWLRHRTSVMGLLDDSSLAEFRNHRDRVLEGAAIRNGDVLLDVGCGAGLIGLGALQEAGSQGRLICVDISEAALKECRQVAGELNLANRCTFVVASAEDLSVVLSESVDVVATRSVLVHVSRKQAAFAEFFRVLRTGARLSIGEPVNRFSCPEVVPVERLFARGDNRLPPNSKPAFDFDERDLLRMIEQAGFVRIQLDYVNALKQWACAGGLQSAKVEPTSLSLI